MAKNGQIHTKMVKITKAANKPSLTAAEVGFDNRPGWLMV